MHFSSEKARNSASSSLSKVYESIFPAFSAIDNKPTNETTAAQNFDRHVKKKKLSKEETRRALNKLKIKKSKTMKKDHEESKKMSKQLTYELIRNHKQKDALSVEEQKYMSKLLKKNLNAINLVSSVEEDFLKQDIDNIKQKLLSKSNKSHELKMKRKQNRKAKEFEEKLQKNIISYPGLTPGLAPVDFNESDSE